MYVLLDPRKPGEYEYSHLKFKYEPFYVGAGHANRYQYHVMEQRYRNAKRTFKYRKISNILKEGLSPEVVLLKEQLTWSEATELEIETIRIIGRESTKNGPLTNLTDGGDGTVGVIPGKQTRLKLKNANIKRFLDVHERLRFKQRMNEPEVVYKLSVASKKRFENPEERERVRKSVLTTMSKPEIKEKISRSILLALKDPEIRKKFLDICKSPERNNKIRSAQLNNWRDEEFRHRMIVRIRETHQTAEFRDKCRNNAKKQWENPKIREKMLIGIRKGIETRRKNKEEKTDV